MRTVFVSLTLSWLALGCGEVAGISDLHTGDLDGSAEDAGGSDSGPAADSGAAADTGNAPPVDAGVDTGPPPPACNTGSFSLTVAVVSSSSSNFTGVTDDGNNIHVNLGGQPFAGCFRGGTDIKLQENSDESSGMHTWTGAPCTSPARQCEFLLTVNTSIAVKL